MKTWREKKKIIKVFLLFISRCVARVHNDRRRDRDRVYHIFLFFFFFFSTNICQYDKKKHDQRKTIPLFSIAFHFDINSTLIYFISRWFRVCSCVFVCGIFFSSSSFVQFQYFFYYYLLLPSQCSMWYGWYIRIKYVHIFAMSLSCCILHRDTVLTNRSSRVFCSFFVETDFHFWLQSNLSVLCLWVWVFVCVPASDLCIRRSSKLYKIYKVDERLGAIH